MLLRNKLNFLLALGFSLIASIVSPVVPSINDKGFILDCVSAHNDIRTYVRPTAANMLHMTWDVALANTAQAWANECTFGHNPNLSYPYFCHPVFKYVGENLWLGSLRIFTTVDAIRSWEEEAKFYDITTRQCSKDCEQYTQVVWADSYKLGCAMTKCPELGGPETVLLVCNYGPRGNYDNTAPYIDGAPCSMCGKGETCESLLCRNATREKPMVYPDYSGYPESKPRGEASQWTACNLFCLVYVYLRMF